MKLQVAGKTKIKKCLVRENFVREPRQVQREEKRWKAFVVYGEEREIEKSHNSYLVGTGATCRRRWASACEPLCPAC